MIEITILNHPLFCYGCYHTFDKVTASKNFLNTSNPFSFLAEILKNR